MQILPPAEHKLDADTSGSYVVCASLMTSAAATQVPRVCAGLKNKRRKKGRLAPHILEDYVELDDAGDVGTPLGRRLGAPGRRPSTGLRPTSALSDRQCGFCP